MKNIRKTSQGTRVANWICVYRLAIGEPGFSGQIQRLVGGDSILTEYRFISVLTLHALLVDSKGNERMKTRPYTSLVNYLTLCDAFRVVGHGGVVVSIELGLAFSKPLASRQASLSAVESITPRLKVCLQKLHNLIIGTRK